MVQRLRFLSPILLLSVMLTQAHAQPVGYWVDSLEVIAGQSSQIVVGKVISFSSETDEGSKRTVTIEVSDTLKGEKQPTLSLQVYLKVSDLAWLKKKGNRVLVAAGPTSPWNSEFVDLEQSNLCFTTADFKLITSPEKALEILKAAAAKFPDPRGFKSFSIRVPKSKVGDQWKAHYTDHFAMGVKVPVDDKLKSWAKNQLKSKDSEQVITGLNALNEFNQPVITEILKAQLKSLLTVVWSSAEDNWGTEVQLYRVRETAYRLLQSRKVDVKEPELHRETPRFDSVKSVRCYAQVTDDQWAKLQRCTNIEKLQLGGKNLDDASFQKIAQLKSLKSVTIDDFWDATPSKMKALASLPNLEECSIPYALIGNDGLDAIAQAPNLHILEINNAHATDKQIAKIKERYPQIDIRLSDAQNPISNEAYYGEVDKLKLILKDRPEFLEVRDFRGYTPLHIAVSNDQIEVARLLLDMGASVNALDKENKTPLMIAASKYYPNMAMMRFLINRGPDVNLQDRNGNTALHLAVSSASTQQIPFLLACGANPLAKNDDGKMPHTQNPQYNRDSNQLVSKIAELMSKPVKFFTPSNADCHNVVYALAFNKTTPWNTNSYGSYSGPIRWSLSPTNVGYLGPFGNQSVNLQLMELPKHKNVTVEFDLWIIGSWDGNGGIGNGPDILDIQVPGVGALLHSSFFNNNEGDCLNLPLQSFPDPYLAGFHPGYTGAAQIKKLGFVEEHPRDAVYHLKMTFAHSVPQLTMIFQGILALQDGGFKLGQDEMWGIGSLKVSTD